MAVLTLRLVKGTPLTNQELDDNFSNLNTELSGKLDAADYTAADVLAKLLTVDGAGSTLNADFVDGLNPETGNTPTSLVARDSSGNFAANMITSDLTGDVTGNVSGTASNITGIAAVANGGTGANNAAQARINLDVDQAGTGIAMAIALG